MTDSDRRPHTVKNRMRATLKAIRAKLRSMMHDPVPNTRGRSLVR